MKLQQYNKKTRSIRKNTTNTALMQTTRQTKQNTAHMQHHKKIKQANNINIYKNNKNNKKLNHQKTKKQNNSLNKIEYKIASFQNTIEKQCINNRLNFKFTSFFTFNNCSSTTWLSFVFFLSF